MFTKHIIMLITTTMLAASVLTGCDWFSSKSNAQKSLDKLETRLIKEEKDKAKDDYKAAHSNYTYSQKDIFFDDKQNELTAIQKEVDTLTVRLNKSKIRANTEANKKLDTLLDELHEIKMDIEEARNVDEAEWENVKNGFATASNRLKKSFENTRQWLSDKIEP